MNKYTAQSVRALKMPEQPVLSEALEAFAVSLEREAEENRRDPVTDPRPGDRVQYKDGSVLVYCEESEDNPGGTTDREFWRSQAKHGATTVIHRQEVQQ